jgi:DNA-binding MarR family transcriptional regulator
MSMPQIGESFRGVDGRTGYLLRQAWQQLQGAMEVALRDHGLSSAQFGVLSVLAREPGAYGADLARGINTSPQAMNGVLAGLERNGLVQRRPHPTHGRILQVDLTDKGRRRLDEARPAVDRLEAIIVDGYSESEIAAIKKWLVTAATRMVEEATSLPDS